MNVRVLLFAALREAAGSREVFIAVPDGASVAELRARLALEYPSLARLLSNAAVAVNEEYADAAARLKAGDVAAFIPPVSGG
jgi:molybdopterin synthase sulfur carrier subunit